MNYHYAALEAGGSCFCGSAEPQEELDLSECPMTCSADDTDYCGGTDYHATIYYVENTISKLLLILKPSIRFWRIQYGPYNMVRMIWSV